MVVVAPSLPDEIEHQARQNPRILSLGYVGPSVCISSGTLMSIIVVALSGGPTVAARSLRRRVAATVAYHLRLKRGVGGGTLL
jgi:hypothetical protein